MKGYLIMAALTSENLCSVSTPAQQVTSVSSFNLLSLLLVWQARAQERYHIRENLSRIHQDTGIDSTQLYLESRKPFWQQ